MLLAKYVNCYGDLTVATQEIQQDKVSAVMDAYFSDATGDSIFALDSVETASEQRCIEL